MTAGMVVCCGRLIKNVKTFNINKWSQRTYCQQKILKKTQNYSSTVLLPQTDFPARHKDAKKAQAEKEIFEKADFAGLYVWQREHLKGPDFVLHDGPPYANGEPHIGHAINKILKDVVLRSNIVKGKRVHYVPGWDCHGLPIELKVLNHGKKKFVTKSDLMDDVTLREGARKCSNEEALKQRMRFESWGVVADWDNQCYYTSDKAYVKNQLRMFYEMYEKGLIYRAVKPVHWSPSSGTALAEAELEYDPEHKSTQIYLEVPLVEVPEQLKALSPNTQYSGVIWTTTPWSLVGNQAICFSPALQYSALSCPDLEEDKLLIIATPLVEEFMSATSMNVEEVFSFDGMVLSSAKYHHPLKEELLPFMEGSHVTDSKGTGLVHTAPAHGPDDFLVALKNDMPVKCFVNEEGCFSDFDPNLDGLEVLGKGSGEIIKRLGDKVLFKGSYVHSYPLDWRTKKPIIIRASSQWFVKTEALKQRALEELDNVKILPLQGSQKNRALLSNQVASRPYWCISRQRAWGTPIPCLYDGDKPIINRELVESIIRQMDEQGINSWWRNPVDHKLVPKSVLDQFNTSIEKLQKGKDIMDIWMDSGLSWSFVLDGHQADLYIEGLDQCTGWFQSSLMTSIAIKNRAPYKMLFIHGFAVDDCGRKMSKSIGNVIDPKLLVQGGKDLKKNPAYGVDTLRWWVAGHATQHSQIVISDSLVNESHSDVSKLRLLLKFLLGTLNDLESSTIEETKQFNYIDSYMLHLLYDFHQKINTSYENMEFNKVRTELLNFTTNQISGLYCHIVKDRLYCEPKESLQRRNCQVVLNHIFVTLCRVISPMLPHLIEEAWSFYPFNKNTAFFKSQAHSPEAIWNRPYMDLMMEIVMKMKRQSNFYMSGLNSFQYDATILARPDIYDMLSKLQSTEIQQFGELAEILQVSQVTLKESNANKEKFSMSLLKTHRHLCGRCRRYTAESEHEPCDRCKDVLNSLE